MHKQTVVVILAMVLSFCWTGGAMADLGITKQEALKRADGYLTKYKAAHKPFIKTDGLGRVAMECWNGPPQGWDKKTAMKFARELVRKGKARPKFVEEDGPFLIYRYPDGTEIVLESFMGKSIMKIHVYAAGYQGGRC